MKVETKGVHFELDEKTRELIDKKLRRINFADDYIVDLQFTLTWSKNGYTCESNANFRWGHSAHLRVEAMQLREGLDLLFDKLELKIAKEKNRIQDHTA